MPLTTDEKLLSLSHDVLRAFEKADGGLHPGFRPAHAKGILLSGRFTPSPGAASLTLAPRNNPDPCRGMATIYLMLNHRIKAREFLALTGDAAQEPAKSHPGTGAGIQAEPGASRSGGIYSLAMA